MSRHIPLERSIQKSILKYLNSLPDVRAVNWHQGRMQKGNPDIICCRRGQLFLFEVKRPRIGEVTPLQEGIIARWRRAGAVVEIVTSVEDVRGVLKRNSKI